MLFELPLTERVDIWFLGLSLCEALLQERFTMSGRAQGRLLQLCRLADFVGPKPESDRALKALKAYIYIYIHLFSTTSTYKYK